MTPTQDYPRSSMAPKPNGGLVVGCLWTIKEKRDGVYVPVARRKNVFTNIGLSGLASAIGGGYLPPLYLVIDSAHTTLTAPTLVGDSTLSVGTSVHAAGDTTLVVGFGTANEEAITFSGYASGVYTLSAPLVNPHASGEQVVRQVFQSDTLAQVVSEVQFDSVDFPMQRAEASSGYAAGTGIYVLQFYITGTQGLVFMAALGLSDTGVVGAGNLHSHLIYCYDHTSGSLDVEIDVQLTITNA